MTTETSTLTGTTEHGIWSDAAGGFVDSGIYTAEQAERDVATLVEQGEDADDLSVLPFCSEHRDDEQPEGSCELCNADDSDDEEGDDDE